MSQYFNNIDFSKAYLGTIPLNDYIVSGQYDTFDGLVGPISASGGTEVIVGNVKIHYFSATGSNTFTIHYGTGNPIYYAVVGGGGGAWGSGVNVGGGGAGTARTGSIIAYTGNYPITVGAGGPSFLSGPNDGGFSVFYNSGNQIIAYASGGLLGGNQIQPPYFDGRGGSNADFTGGGTPTGGGAGAAGNGTAGGPNSNGLPGAGLQVTMPGVNQVFGTGGVGFYLDATPQVSGSGGFAGANNAAKNAGANGIVIVSYYT
jgi:hypothetical protein